MSSSKCDAPSQPGTASSQPRVLALITARGGSKSVPRKNIAPVAGKPLLAHTIAAARQARGIDRVIVSTDDAEIAEVGRRYCAEVPFLRPAELAQDHTPSIDPVLHALRWLDEHEGYRPDYVMLLQPTSPMRTAEDIEGAIRLAVDHDADAVIALSPAGTHPYWAIKINADGRMENYLGLDLTEAQRKYPRRQDLPPAYEENGAVYLTRRSVLLEQGSFYGQRVYGYVMPAERSLDIDTPLDLQIVDLILSSRAAP